MDFELVPMLVIFLFFGLPWIIVYLQGRRMSALEVEVPELSTLIKAGFGQHDGRNQNA